MLNGNEHESTGVYREVVAPKRLAMTWRWLTMDDAESLVEIDLWPVEGGTEMTFTHSRLPSREARDGHFEGWTGAFDKLEAMFKTK
jgi:uncharacterized protein YndB with AHSA1/START domain